MPEAITERLPLRERLQRERGRVWVVGHRGAMGHSPENTMASFERGLELGADWIELDVHLSRDAALIVIHDETLDRTTDGRGLVRERTLHELKQLDAGAGQQIPTLDEVLAWAHARNTILDIEIKNAPVYYDGIEAAVVASVQRADMTGSVIVISFDHSAVQRVKALDGRIATGVLYACRPADAGVSLAHQAGADAVLPHWAYVTPADVRVAHEAGLAVAPWASSDPEVLRHLIACGVDAIGTNHPDVLREVIASVVAAPSVGDKSSPSETTVGATSRSETKRGDTPRSEPSPSETTLRATTPSDTPRSNAPRNDTSRSESSRSEPPRSGTGQRARVSNGNANVQAVQQ